MALGAGGVYWGRVLADKWRDRTHYTNYRVHGTTCKDMQSVYLIDFESSKKQKLNPLESTYLWNFL